MCALNVPLHVFLCTGATRCGSLNTLAVERLYEVSASIDVFSTKVRSNGEMCVGSICYLSAGRRATTCTFSICAEDSSIRRCVSVTDSKIGLVVGCCDGRIHSSVLVDSRNSWIGHDANIHLL